MKQTDLGQTKIHKMCLFLVFGGSVVAKCWLVSWLCYQFFDENRLLIFLLSSSTLPATEQQIGNFHETRQVPMMQKVDLGGQSQATV
jgi:hypothetical protein